MRHRTCVLTVLLSLGAMSCGQKKQLKENIFQMRQQLSDGHYGFTLHPVNPAITPNLRGEGTIEIDGDRIQINIDADGLDRVVHVQHIHRGGRCPSEADDRDGNGVLDVTEAHARAGEVLVPLDDDLHSQKAGSEEYPFGQVIRYSQSAYLSSLLADLRNNTLSSGLGRLHPNEALNLHGKVIEIHGVAKTTHLPPRLGTVANLPVYETLPVACGRIRRLGY